MGKADTNSARVCEYGAVHQANPGAVYEPGVVGGHTGVVSTVDPLRRELGAFLRGSREQLDPTELGLPTTRRRRTPGLRREEVAASSGVGLAWYTWLEQGRVVTSRQVLESLATTLRMTPDERRHLLTLGGYAVVNEPGGEIVDDLLPLLESWQLTPALLLDHRFDVLAGNVAYSAVWPEPVLPVDSTARPNLLHALATNYSLRTMPVSEPDLVYELFLRFRVRVDRHADDPGVWRVLDGLHAARPDLAHWWDCRAVRDSGTWPAVLELPGGPTLRLAFSLLQPGGSSTTLLVQAPVDEVTTAWIRQRVRQ